MRAFTGGIAGLMFPDTDMSRLQPFGQSVPFSDLLDKGITLRDMGGPPAELGIRLVDSTLGNAKLWAVLTGEIEVGAIRPAAIDIVNDIFKNIASYNRWDKAITAAQMGKLYTNSGLLKQDDLTILDAGMLALGFPPRESKEAYDAEVYNKDVEQKIFKDAKIASQFLIKAWQYEPGSNEWKLNHGYFEYLRKLNVDGDISGNGGTTFTRTVEQLVRNHKAFNEKVWLEYQRNYGRSRQDLKREKNG